MDLPLWDRRKHISRRVERGVFENAEPKTKTRLRSTEEGGCTQADEAVKAPTDIRIPYIASSPNNRSSSVSHGSVRHFE
jgi:hypothetical protein